MASGFFMGGLAEGFQKQSALTNAQNYEQGILKIQQQRLQQQANQQILAQIDDAKSALFKHIDESKVADLQDGQYNPKALYQGISPNVDGIADLLKKTQGPDAAAMFRAQVATALTAPASTVGEAAHAAAKEPPGAAQERLARAGYYKRGGLPEQSAEEGAATYNDQSLTQRQRVGLDPLPANYRVAQAFEAAGVPAPTKPEAMLPDQKADAFLEKLPEGLRTQVQDLADYKISPQIFSTRTYKGQTESQRSKMVRLAEQYARARGDSYDQRLYNASNGAIGNFYKGAEARTARSFNVLVDHLDTLKDATTALANGDNQTFNQIKNAIANWTGKPAPNSFDAVKTVVADELVKAVIGSSSGALGDREAIASTVTTANSPQQLANVIDRYQQLAGGQLAGLRTQFNGIPGSPQDFDSRFLNDRTKKLLRITIPNSTKKDDDTSGGITVHGFTFTPGQ